MSKGNGKAQGTVRVVRDVREAILLTTSKDMYHVHETGENGLMDIEEKRSGAYVWRCIGRGCRFRIDFPKGEQVVAMFVTKIQKRTKLNS